MSKVYKEIPQPISPPKNTQKLIKQEDIDHFNREYFKYNGEQYLKLYDDVSNISEFYPKDSVEAILNDIIELYVKELRINIDKDSYKLITLSYILKLKKELFGLLDKMGNNAVDRLKLIAIIKAYILDL